MKKILVTGGAGFIGTNFVYYWSNQYPKDKIVVLDALTYAGRKINLESLISQEKIIFEHGNICNSDLVTMLFNKYEFETIVHFAAETHVDRSILTPNNFIKTNIEGTHILLAAALNAWKDDFNDKRFHHISTDEIYGQLEPDEEPFTEISSINPRSPYAASKAASDLLVRTYHITYGLPITISNCSNNYGPYQFPEKFIALMLINILEGKKLPIYGDGLNIRDWLFVDDHCRGIDIILNDGVIGETYNIGGGNEIVNLDLVRVLCQLIDKKITGNELLRKQYLNCPAANKKKSESLISFVKDRPAHDKRYAINPSKIVTDLGFHPSVSFKDGLSITLDWYLSNENWWRPILSGEYKKWIEKQYTEI